MPVMVRIDKLEIAGLNPLYMSSHPLDQVQLKADFPGKIAEFIRALAELQVRAVTVLLPEQEIDRNATDIDLLAEYRRADLAILHYPLENFSTPDTVETFDRLTAEIIGLLAEGSVLVHCQTGCGRTVMVAAGVLIKRGMQAPAAIHRIYLARPSSRPTINQIQFLREYRTRLDEAETRA